MIANWIAAIGQALGALFTAAAIVVALGIARRDSRNRREEAAQRSLAQARLVRVGGPPGTWTTGQTEQGIRHDLIFRFANHSDRPVLDVYFEAWPRHEPFSDRPEWVVRDGIALPGRDGEVVPHVVTPD